MSKRQTSRLRAAVLSIVLATAIVGGTVGTSAAQTGTTLANGGPCRSSLSKIQLGLVTTVDSPVLSQKEQADGADAAVKAFNKRGGVAGHCMDLTVCNDRADANEAATCARGFRAGKVVATVHDSTTFGSADVAKTFEKANIARVGIAPNIPDLTSKVAYPMGAGGVGNTLMMVPPLAKAGVKRIYAIGLDNPQLDALPGLMKRMLDANGVRYLGLSKVTAGTTDYQQFILAAERAGADGVILPVGENEAFQVLQAAQQLGTDLRFSASLGTFSKAKVQSMGRIARQVVFNGEMPPLTASTKTWPILSTISADLAASGKANLQRDRVTSLSMRSWMSVYEFVTIMSTYGDVGAISGTNVAAARAAVVAAMNKATKVNTFGLFPAWTPNQRGGFANFSRISQPYYYQVRWNGDSFFVDRTRLNINEEMNGNTKYPQPAG